VNTTSFTQFGARLRDLVHGDFEESATELFRVQFETNPAYRLICKARGLTPQTVKHWSEIPAVPTTAFKKLELSCLRPEQRTHVFHSSGTTGQKPSRHFHNAESLALYEESLLIGFRQNVVATRPVVMLLLMPPKAEAPHSSLVHMFETVRRELGAADSEFLGRVTSDGEWTVALETSVSKLGQACHANEPVCILGTAFSFVHFLDHLRDQGKRIQLPPGSIAMETGGYKGKSRELPRVELHNLISSHLGIRPRDIVCEYGMSELSSQAYGKVSSVRCQGTDRKNPHALNPTLITRSASPVPLTPDTRHSPLFHFPPWARAQIISPETGREVNEGETGLIRVFDLANVYSVMAIQTEDLAIKRGSGFELLGRAALAEPRGCSLMSLA